VKGIISRRDILNAGVDKLADIDGIDEDLAEIIYDETAELIDKPVGEAPAAPVEDENDNLEPGDDNNEDVDSEEEQEESPVA
ncbi:helix-hairpin-helix domain-containing protein, partial [bacterium]|nr:helix-hairpin-helix domain-containing protein [bacterium]